MSNQKKRAFKNWKDPPFGLPAEFFAPGHSSASTRHSHQIVVCTAHLFVDTAALHHSMSITPDTLYVPQPATQRAQPTALSYDAVHDRLAYANGKSIFVRPLDPASSLPSRQFSKHIHTTTVAAFSPSGNYIASGDESGAVKVWDAAVLSGPGAGDSLPFDQPYIKSEFQILAGPIRSIAWDADNSRIIAVGTGKDKFGHCFTWDSGNSIGEIQGHAETINAVDIKPQRPYRAATVSDDKALVFYNGPPFKFDKSIRGHHSNSVKAVKFSPDGQWLVSVGADRTIVVYEGKTGDFVTKIDNAHEGGIYGVAWFTDLSAFVTASADGTLKSWTAGKWAEKQTYIVDEKASVSSQQVAVVVAKQFVVSLSLDGTLNYFEHDGSFVKRISGHQKPLTSVVYEKDLYTGGSDGDIYKRGVSGAINAVPELAGSHTNYVVSLSASDSLVSSGWDDTIKVGSTTVPLGSQPKHSIVAGESVVVALEQKVVVLDKSGLIVSEADLPFVTSNVAVAGDKLLLTNTSQNRVEEYSLDSLRSVSSYPALRAPPTLVRVSPDGELVAVADSAGKYTLYKTSDHSVVTTRWAFHSSKVLDAKWTPDSKHLLSGGLDSGLFAYSVDRPAKVVKFPLAHQNGVTGVEWLLYGDKKGKFVSVGSDAVLKTWAIEFP